MTVVVHDGRPQILGNLCEERRTGDELVLWLGRLGRAPLAGSAGPAWHPWCSGLPTLVSGCRLSASCHPQRGRPRPLQSFPEGANGGCQASTRFYWSRRVTHCLPTMKGRKTGGKENVAVSNHRSYRKWQERKV